MADQALTGVTHVPLNSDHDPSSHRPNLAHCRTAARPRQPGRPQPAAAMGRGGPGGPGGPGGGRPMGPRLRSPGVARPDPARAGTWRAPLLSREQGGQRRGPGGARQAPGGPVILSVRAGRASSTPKPAGGPSGTSVLVVGSGRERVHAPVVGSGFAGCVVWEDPCPWRAGTDEEERGAPLLDVCHPGRGGAQEPPQGAGGQPVSRASSRSTPSHTLPSFRKGEGAG